MHDIGPFGTHDPIGSYKVAQALDCPEALALDIERNDA